MEMDQKKIGSFIAELRKEKHLTQEQFAECLGMNHRSVSRWETGDGMPDVALLPVLAGVILWNQLPEQMPTRADTLSILTMTLM